MPALIKERPLWVCMRVGAIFEPVNITDAFRMPAKIALRRDNNVGTKYDVVRGAFARWLRGRMG